MVPRDNISLFINAQAAVSIAVVSKAHVKTVFHHIFAKSLNVCGACVHVDIGAVRGSVYNISLCTQSVKDGFCNVPRAAVCAVKSHLHAPERVHSEGNKVAHIAVSARNVVNSAADVLTVGKGNFLPLLSEHFKLAVNVILNKRNGLLVHFLAVSVDKLYAIVIVWVVAGGYHNAAVKLINPCNICNRWGGGNMEQICVRSRSGKSADNGIFKHIA